MKLSLATRRYLCFALCLIPMAILVFRTFTDRLGIDPYETLISESGEKALQFLLLSLAITPLMTIKSLAKRGWVVYKKPLGLASFAYALAHFLIFLTFDVQFDLQALYETVLEKPYILVGMAALIILLLMSITSINRLIRAMGAKHWQRLHRGVYLAAILVMVHYLWLLKSLIVDFWVYAALTSLLLGFRAWKAAASRKKAWLK